MPISSTMFFGAFILFSTLVVAAIAILKNAHDLRGFRHLLGFQPAAACEKINQVICRVRNSQL